MVTLWWFMVWLYYFDQEWGEYKFQSSRHAFVPSHLYIKTHTTSRWFGLDLSQQQLTLVQLHTHFTAALYYVYGYG